MRVQHLGLDWFGCMEKLGCSKRFDTSEDLKLHVEQLHSNMNTYDGSPIHFVCKSCGRKFDKFTTHFIVYKVRLFSIFTELQICTN